MVPSSASLALALSNKAFCHSVEVIESDSTDKTNLGTGFAFRGWNYIHILIRLLLDAIDEEVCADTGCGVTLANRSWLLALLPHVEIRRMSSPLCVKGLGSAMHNTNEYVLIPIYFPAFKQDGTRVLCCIVREIHLVHNLKARMLLGNNLIGPEKIVLDVTQNKAYIRSCGVTTTITSWKLGPYQRRAIVAKEALTIVPRTDAVVPIATFKALPKRDFIFEPRAQRDLTMFAHLVDSQMSGVLVKNETNHFVQIPRKLCLGMLCEIDYENIFFVEPTILLETPAPTVAKWVKKVTTSATVATMSPARSLLALCHNTVAKDAADVPKEIKLPNGVMVYGDSNNTKVLFDLVAEYPRLWNDEGFANIPEEDWMTILLRDDWQSRLPKSNSAKIYPLGIKDRDVVNKTFDALQ